MDNKTKNKNIQTFINIVKGYDIIDSSSIHLNIQGMTEYNQYLGDGMSIKEGLIHSLQKNIERIKLYNPPGSEKWTNNNIVQTILLNRNYYIY